MLLPFLEPATRSVHIELLSEHAHVYLNAAKSVALQPSERPRLFTLTCYHLLGGQGHSGQLSAEAEAVSLLGFNTANVYGWQGIPPLDIKACLGSFGLKLSRAAYRPITTLEGALTLFDF